MLSPGLGCMLLYMSLEVAAHLYQRFGWMTRPTLQQRLSVALMFPMGFQTKLVSPVARQFYSCIIVDAKRSKVSRVVGNLDLKS